MVDPYIAGGNSEDLPASARAVSASVTALTAQIAQLAGGQRRSWRAIIGAYALWLIEIGIVVGLIIFVIGLNNTNARLEASITEQCSLYSLIIPSYREEARRVSPLGPEGYDEAFRRMQVSADNLGCGIPHTAPRR